VRILEDLEPDDAAGQVLLEAIVAEADLVEKLEQAIALEGVTIAGARGNKVAHPALSALVRHRKLLVELAEKLMPAEPTSEDSRRSSAAALAKWRRGR
jgi:hypothetical protein